MAAVDDWRDRAACTGLGPDLFFSDDLDVQDRVKQVCERCPVQPECLDFGMTQEFGVWGGLSVSRRRAKAQAGTPTPEPLVFEVTTYTTRARSTGSTCSAGRTAEIQWGATCVTHNRSATTANRTAAEYAVSRPEEWCPECTLAFRERVG